MNHSRKLKIYIVLTTPEQPNFKVLDFERKHPTKNDEIIVIPIEVFNTLNSDMERASRSQLIRTNHSQTLFKFGIGERGYDMTFNKTEVHVGHNRHNRRFMVLTNAPLILNPGEITAVEEEIIQAMKDKGVWTCTTCGRRIAQV
jgi:hypothetical protein